MKKLWSASILTIAVSIPLVAQPVTFGPKFKNQKAWDKVAKTETVVPARQQQVFGPEFKNTKITELHTPDRKETKISTDATRRKEFGPAYKNRKPWED